MRVPGAKGMAAGLIGQDYMRIVSITRISRENADESTNRATVRFLDGWRLLLT